MILSPLKCKCNKLCTECLSQAHPQMCSPVSLSTQAMLINLNKFGYIFFFTGKNKMWLKRGLKHFFFPNSEVHADNRMTPAGIYLSDLKSWGLLTCLKISPCWNSLVGLRSKPCNCHFSHQCQWLNWIYCPHCCLAFLTFPLLLELLHVSVSLFYIIVACLFFSPIHHLSCYIPFPSHTWSPILSFPFLLQGLPRTASKLGRRYPNYKFLQVVGKVYTDLPWICVSSMQEGVEMFPGLAQFAARDTLVSHKPCADTKSSPGDRQSFGSLWRKKWTRGLVTCGEVTKSRHEEKAKISHESSILFSALK